MRCQKGPTSPLSDGSQEAERALNRPATVGWKEGSILAAVLLFFGVLLSAIPD